MNLLPPEPCDGVDSANGEGRREGGRDQDGDDIKGTENGVLQIVLEEKGGEGRGGEGRRGEG